MLLPLLRSATLAATFTLAATLSASAQTFGEFLSKPELPLTLMGVDFSAAKYYGPPLTVDPQEMKGQFTKINELLVREADKYDLTKALHREPGKVLYATNIAESANQKIDPATVIVPSSEAPRAHFSPQTIEGQVTHYNYPEGASGVGIVFVVEDIDKNKEQEIFWVTFVDLATKRMLYTEKLSGTGMGFGFRNHWAAPIYAGIKTVKFYYGNWKKRFAKG